MTGSRAFLSHHPWLCALLFSAALLARAMMPMGFMPVVSNGVVFVQFCTGQGAATLAISQSLMPQTVAMTMPGTMPGPAGDTDQEDRKQPEATCAFSGLSFPTLAAADPLLLAVAIAFIIATTFRLPSRPALQRAIYLRPPAIGPPAA